MCKKSKKNVIREKGKVKSKKNKAGYTANTSCGPVGRGRNAGFPTFQLDDPGRTNGPMDGRTDGQSLL